MYKLDIKELRRFMKTLKVLYVEDNNEVREALLDLLKNFFDDIVVAINGLDGVEKFKSCGNIDLIISDIQMPNMNGLEMIKNIKKIQSEIPVVITTAHQESELLIESIKVGVNAYLLKPIGYKQCNQTIIQICEKIFYMQKHQEYETSLEELVQERTKELEESKKKLLKLVNRDPMTSLYNRRYFNEISPQLMNIAYRDKNELSLLMIDIDKFKNINDTYGHMVGDIILKKLSHLLHELTRESDLVFRFGGEEFLIILPSTKNKGAILIAKKIRNAVEALEINIEKNIDKIIKFTISIGIAQCDCDDDNNIDNLVHRADEALYEAKRNGRNRVVLYEKKVI